MIRKLLSALGLASGRGDAIEALRQALETGALAPAQVQPTLERLLESPFALISAYDLFDDHAARHPTDPRGPLWRGWLLTRSIERGLDPCEPDIVADARRYVARAAALGADAGPVASLQATLARLLPENLMTIDLLGVTVRGEGWVEQGSEPLTAGAPLAAAAKAFCEAFSARFAITEGSGLVRTPEGSFFFYVEGDGERCSARPVDDPGAQAEFSVLFARTWAAAEAEAASRN